MCMYLCTSCLWWKVCVNIKNVLFNRTNMINKDLCNYNELCLEFVKICLLNVKGFRECTLLGYYVVSSGYNPEERSSHLLNGRILKSRL